MVAKVKTQSEIHAAAIARCVAKCDLVVKNFYGNEVLIRQGETFYQVASDEVGHEPYVVYWSASWSNWRCTCAARPADGCKHRRAVQAVLVARRAP